MTLNKLAARPYLVLFLIWCWCYLPGLGLPELEAEEGHRAGASQEMMLRGDWVRPVFHGVDYLNKPPGYYWFVMLLSWPTGVVNEWTVRLPSALANLAGAWMVAAVAPWFGGTALVSGVVFLLTPQIFAKGLLGEIDALFSVQIFFALCLFARVVLADSVCPSKHQRLSRWWWNVLAPGVAGLILGWAVLTKGPLAWLFFYLAVGCYSFWKRSWQWLWRPGHILLVILSTSVVVLWVWLLAQRSSLEVAFSVWFSDLGGARVSSNWWREVGDFFEYPFALLGGFLPGWIALAWFWNRYRKGDSSPAEKKSTEILTSGTLPAALMIWIHGRRVRYAMPAGPVLALAGGVALQKPYTRVSRHPKGGWWLLLAIFLVGAVRFGIFVGESYWESPNRALAAEIIQHLPQDTEMVIYTTLAKQYDKTAFYLRRNLQGIKDPATLEGSGAYALIIQPVKESMSFEPVCLAEFRLEGCYPLFLCHFPREQHSPQGF